MPLITEEQARARYEKEKKKLAASSKAAKHTKARIGKRPIRVDTLLNKESAESGADLRLPVMGGTKFPTKDSLQYSKKLLKKHMDAAEMGGPSQGIKSVVPNYSSKLDVMPKTGADMTIENDPLVQYLRKEAQDTAERTAGKDWPKGAPPEPKNAVESNLSDMPKGDTEKALTSEDPTPMNPAFPAKEGVKDWKSYLSTMFNNQVKKKKCAEKDYPATTGQVDKVVRS